MDSLTVRVMRRGGRKFFTAWWLDPTTGMRCTRSTGATKRREAERFAAEIEREIRQGAYRNGSTPWPDFKARFLDEGIEGLRESSIQGIESAFRAADRIIAPKSLETMTRPETLARFRRGLVGGAVRRTADDGEVIEVPRSPASVNRILRSLSSAFGWARRAGLLDREVSMPFVRREQTAVAKSRAVVTEEFDRLLVAAGKVAPQEADEVRFLLRLLWTSGMRLGEALSLRWFDGPVALDRSRGGAWVVRLAAAAQKAKRDSVVPLPPDAVELIESVPADAREGLVVLPNRKARSVVRVSKLVTEIAKRAGVFTASAEASGKTIRKPAGAHDLRRAFASRWAGRVMPQVLGAMMRHKSVATTMTFYVDFAPDDLAEIIRGAASGDTSGDTCRKSLPAAGSADSRKSLPLNG